MAVGTLHLACPQLLVSRGYLFTEAIMKTVKISLSLAIWMSMSFAAPADVLELKNGTVLNGKYLGGTTESVRFDAGSGTQVIQTSQIIALTFTATGAGPVASAPPGGGVATPAVAPAAAPAPVTAPTAAPAAQSVTLPAGTILLVRTMDSISSKNKAGTPFTTKLETDLSGNGGVGVKGGTVVYGRVQSSTQAGRAVGRSTLDLRLTQIVVNGQSIPIMTSGYQDAGQRSVAKAAKGAAAGAAIGAIAGDAGKGAAIGAVGGAVIRGQTITVPPGTLLEFTLQQPATVPASQ